jgi:hypothetical protein
MFGERVRKIGRSEERPEKQPAGNGGKVGAGVVVAIVLVVLRVLVGLGSRTSSKPQATLPPAPRWQAPNPVPLQHEPPLPRDRLPWEVPLPDMERRIEELEKQGFVLPQPQPEAFLLHEEDVPILRGLCYHIDHEGRQAKDSPGQRIWQLLDEDGRKLVRDAAAHRDLLLKGNDEPQQAPVSVQRILNALNGVLRRPELYQRAAFREVNLPTQLRGLAERNLEGKTPRRPGDVLPLNRWLLEAAYRAQVLPQHLRHDPAARRKWRMRALTDIINATLNQKPVDR